MNQSHFKSKQELKSVIDAVVRALESDDVAGRKLRALHGSIQINFTDLDATLNVRSGEAGEPNMVWNWSKRAKCDPVTTLYVSSNVANRFMQGKLRVAAALALRKVKVEGSLSHGLKIVSICHPMFGHYVAHIEAQYPHLVM